MRIDDIKVGNIVRCICADNLNWHGVEYRITGHRPVSWDRNKVLVIGEVTKPVPNATLGSKVQFYHPTLELVKPEKDELQVGDKVRYNGEPDANFKGMRGVVEEISRISAKVRVTESHFFPKGTAVYPYLKNIEKDVSFAFDDIKVGDKVRRTETWDSGTTMVVEGVVNSISSSRALTKESLRLGVSTDPHNPHVTLELLERPEPHFTETDKVGTRYRVKSIFESEGWRFLVTKIADNQWERIDLTGATDVEGDQQDKHIKDFLNHREYALVK